VAEPKVYDLDILRPDPVFVKILGERIDISFVPVGVAAQIENLQHRLKELRGARTDVELADDSEFGLRNLEIMTDIVVLIAADNQNITRDALMAGCSVDILDKLITLAFRHMYGPRTGARITEEIEKAKAGGENGAASENGGSGRSVTAPGPKLSRSAASSSDGNPITS
jgi:hypothetical protein